MRRRYKIFGVLFALLLSLSVGFLYALSNFGEGTSLRPQTVSGLQAGKKVVLDLIQKRASLEKLKTVLGEPAFEFDASKSKMLIYRSVTEYPGGGFPIFETLGLVKDYTSIEEIWLIEVSDDHVSAYKRVRRVYYPMHAKDIIFGLDNGAYGENGYWKFNILPHSQNK